MYFADVILQCSAERVPIDVAFLRHGEVHRPDYTCWTVDRLADGDLVHGNVRIEPVHVVDRVDRHQSPNRF